MIELMIVVAIIGILAAVALPQYQDYIVRSKLAAAATSLESIKMAVAEEFQSSGSFPNLAALNSAGVSVINPAGAAITVAGGATSVITLSFSSALGSTAPFPSTLVYTANSVVGNSSLKWVVTQTGMSGAAAVYVATKLNGL